MCFLDLTGYTRLTEERGDDAAADLAARIAEYARPGEVLVSQEVVDAADGGPVTFTEIGPVELKGVSGPLHPGGLVSCALNRSDKSRLGVWREQEGPRLNCC
jgi:class 3 adenylate cyclase